MSLYQALHDDERRTQIAADAVTEAGEAVRARTGIGAVAAQVGLDTINMLRPGFLQRHVHAMLPAMALAIEPHWEAGVCAGDPVAFLEAAAGDVTQELLHVSDAYVTTATDAKAIAVYNQLRPRAQRRIEEQMPRIALFIQRNTPPAEGSVPPESSVT